MVTSVVKPRVPTFTSAHALLDNGLHHGEPLWRPKPFHGNVGWRSTHSSLYRAAINLSDEELRRLQRDGRALHDFVCQHESSFAVVAETSALLDEEAARFAPEASTAKGRDHIGIPGKKWDQVEAFASSIPKRRLPAVDYCAGKGFLSQRLVARGVAQSSTCLELDEALITAGRQLASRASLPLSFSRTDVLGPRPLIPSDDPASCHVALHACGGLHRSALRNAVHAGAELIAIAPCCFHKWPDGSDEANQQWQPLSSTAASHSKLSINYEELRLACAGEAAAKRRDERLRLREMKWRLAFGVWHRRAHLRNRRKQQRSASTTTASVDWSAASRLPSVPLPLLSQGSSGEVSIDGFREFCKWGATVKGESLPMRRASGLEHAVEDGVWSDSEAEACLRIGEAHASKVARLELVRHAYRRPLEQWLVLDLCLYMEEQGYAVTMKRFCEPLTSPRNLLVLGERSKA